MNSILSTQTDLNALKWELKSLIVTAANLQMSQSDIADDAQLFQGGIGLDSIDLLEVVVCLDKKYGFKVQNNEQGKRALQNIDTLANALYTHLNA